MWRTYLINLPQDTGRYARSAAQLESLGIEFVRVSAVDGRALSDDEVACVYDVATNRRRARYPLTRPEIGCYLSHIKVWRQIAESSDAGGFIFEDDFQIAADTKEIMAQLSHSNQTELNSPSGGKLPRPQTLCVYASACWWLSPQNAEKDGVGAEAGTMPDMKEEFNRWDIIKLFTLKPQPRCIRRQPLTPSYQIVTPYRVPNGTVAYGITKQCAQQLIKTAQPFFRPIDEDHKFFWEHNLKIALVLPPPVTHRDQQSTTGTVGIIRRQSARNAAIPQKIRQIPRNLFYRLRYSALLHYHRRKP